MPQGKVTTYDLTVGVIVNIEDIIVQLNPADVPLLGMQGAEGGGALSRGSCFEKKVEWLDDTLLTPRSTLNGSITTGTTDIVIATADANHFGVGDLLLVDAEYVRVTVLSTDGVTLTVTRAYGGSTAVNHTTGVVVTGVGKTLPEGSDPEIARSVDRSQRYNLTQIFGPEKVQTSMTENVIRKYGLRTTEFDYQAGQRAKELYIGLESAILYGTRNDDTGNKIRSMGGLKYYITTNIDSSTTTLTDVKLLDQLQTIFTAGGNPDTVLVGAKQKRVISSFESTMLRTPRTDNARGEMVDTYMSDFGVVRTLLDRWVRVSDLFVFDHNQVELDTLRPLQFEMLAKTGDSQSGQIVCEHTLVVRRELHAARFSALT